MDTNKNITANYQSTVNITTIKNDNQLMVYPNPASDNVIVRFPAYTGNPTIEIVDTSGKSFLHQKLDGKKELLLKTESYPDGMYFIRLSGQNKTITATFILK